LPQSLRERPRQSAVPDQAGNSDRIDHIWLLSRQSIAPLRAANKSALRAVVSLPVAICRAAHPCTSSRGIATAQEKIVMWAVQSHRHRISRATLVETYQCLRGGCDACKNGYAGCRGYSVPGFLPVGNQAILPQGEPKLFLPFPAPSPGARSQPGLSGGNGSP
jgi:hypothetical protein